MVQWNNVFLFATKRPRMSSTGVNTQENHGFSPIRVSDGVVALYD
jgi:hypothetical protein